jgi:hypothetical protein
MRAGHRAVIAGCIVLGLACGCGGKKPTSPAARDVGMAIEATASGKGSSDHGSPHSGGGEFYPLTLGNRWDYLARYVVSGGGGDDYVYESRFRDELTHVASHDGYEYFVAPRTYEGESGPSYWIQYRQDRDGLYEWEGLIRGSSGTTETRAPVARPRPTWRAVAARLGVPEGSAPWRAAWQRAEERCAVVALMARRAGAAGTASVAVGELQRLAYPLRVGQRWDVRQDPHFWSVVVGPARLSTPAGTFNCWAIRMGSEFFGPNDVGVTWYGTSGYLGYRFTFEEQAVDPSGNVMGTMQGMQSETLTGLSIRETGHH